MGKKHLISKWGLAYYGSIGPRWKKRATRGHERAAQKRNLKKETER